MSKQDTIISLLKEINENIDNVGSGGNVPKVKVSYFKVTNKCINDDGIWEGQSLIDTSEIIDMGGMFIKITNLKHLNVSHWDVSKVTNLNSFVRETNIERLDLSMWDTSNVQIIYAAFYNCKKLKWLNLAGFNGSKLTSNSTSVFEQANYIETLVGDHTIDDVINNDIKVFDGLMITVEMTISQNPRINRASLRALINGLADLTGSHAQTLLLGETLIAKLTEEDIAIATGKNWTIA